MGIVNRIALSMLDRMNKEEKMELTGQIADKLLAEMTSEDKKKLVADMLPHIMEELNMMDLMPQIMMNKMKVGEGQGGPMGMMSKMMNQGK